MSDAYEKYCDLNVAAAHGTSHSRPSERGLEGEMSEHRLASRW